MGKRKGHGQPADKSSGGPQNQWTVNDIRAILHNPIYVGLGPYPPLIDEATWIRAQERMVRDDGVEAVLLQMRSALLETFGYVPAVMDGPTWLQAAQTVCTERGVRAYLENLISELRREYSEL